MEGFTLGEIPWSGIGWSGLISLTIISIIKGWLVPKLSHDTQILLLTNQINDLKEERDAWKEAAKSAEAVASEVREQNKSLLKTSEVTASTLEKLHNGLERTKYTTGDASNAES